MKQNSGYISASSELGVGTTFTIYLPRLDEKAEAAPSRVENTKGTETVLVAEDEHTVRELTCRFTCPNCNGTLWELQDGELLRYRCRISHTYSTESMIEANSDSLDRALWSAVRALEESAALSRRIAQKTGILREEMNKRL